MVSGFGLRVFKDQNPQRLSVKPANIPEIGGTKHMSKLASILNKFSGGMNMKSQEIQLTDLNSDTPIDDLNMNVLEKIEAVKQRYIELEDNCKQFFRNWDNLANHIDGLKFILAGKSLDLEQRLEMEERLEHLVNSQKEQAREYERQKRLRSKIYKGGISLAPAQTAFNFNPSHSRGLYRPR